MNVAIVVLILGAILVMGARTLSVLIAYVGLAALATAVSAPAAFQTPVATAVFVAASIMKLIVAPIGIALFVRRNGAARDLRPAVSVPFRLCIILGLIGIAQTATHVWGLVVPAMWMPVYVMFCGLAVLIVDRNLIAALLGLLVFGTGVTMAAATVAPGLPETIELGAAFDALVGTFIGLALVRAFVRHNPLLDVSALRELRG